MKDKKEDKALRELFQDKLGKAEVIPSPSVSKALMRKLALRRFLHFNATSFNVWYAGGIVIAGSLVAVILSSDPGKNEQTKQAPVSTEFNTPLVNEAVKEETTKSSAGNDAEGETVYEAHRDKKSGAEISSDKSAAHIQDDQKKSTLTSVDIPDISEEGLIMEDKTGRNNLKVAVKQSDNLIAASVTEGCAPLKVIFKSIIPPQDSCRWTFGDGGYSTDRNTEWLYDIEGEYNVTLIVFTAGGNKISSSTDILVHPKPVARFEITPEDAILPHDEIIFMNYSTNAVKYKWDFGDGTMSELFEPRHVYSKYGDYNVQLIAFSEYGCTDSLVILNAFSGSAYSITFPNAFIPNPNGPSGGYYSPRSDESAFVFHPVYSGVAEYQLRIFSRLGILIFESNDINIGWDGYYKGALSEPGVYIWKVRGKYMSGEPFTKMGDVTLLKN